MNKYTLVTGASSGIGKAFAEYYAKEKKNLILIARSEEKLSDLKQQLEKQFKVKVQTFSFDLSEQKVHKKFIVWFKNRMYLLRH